MKTSVNKILNYLEKNGPVTIAQIARAVDLTKADVRYQLRQLLSEGRIIQLPSLFPTSPGRPAALFTLKIQVPEALYRLIIACILNKQVEKSDIAQAIVKELLGSKKYSGSPGARLAQKAKNLSQFGINIRWEAGRYGPDVCIEQEPITNAIPNEILSSRVLELLLADLQEKSPA